MRKCRICGEEIPNDDYSYFDDIAYNTAGMCWECFCDWGQPDEYEPWRWR